MNILFDNAAEISRWLKEPAAASFLSWIKELNDRALKHLREDNESHDIYRNQGRVDILRQVLSLQVDLSEHLHRKVTTQSK